MSSRSLNRVLLIGNATNDVTLRYTPSNDSVCTFTIATNRSWKTEKGEQKEDTEFHRLVAWGKLAEICSQLIKKGTKVFVQGRLSTRTMKNSDETEKTYTEIVVEDMIVLSSKPKEETEPSATIL
jgi:single-strand DNA-binding protein